ncbi:AMP-binding protein, partial [Francisella tularensis subsp. holarctica]|uniref:AMP-binding protein n=1 Tax=Francisella tularensis TaxID=263 RepID=UPI002381C2E2
QKTIKQLPYREAVSCHDLKLNFIELYKLDTKMASFLQNNLGINKVDRVAIVLPNCLQYTVSLFACVKIGAVLVNINP